MFLDSLIAAGAPSKPSSARPSWVGAPALAPSAQDAGDSSAMALQIVFASRERSDTHVRKLEKLETRLVSRRGRSRGAACARQVLNATCEGSEWGYCRPTEIPADCRDSAGWLDREGEGCAAYGSQRYCTPQGGQGPGWNQARRRAIAHWRATLSKSRVR